MDATFGDKLKRLREQAGLTQQQLAERASVTRDGVAQWERGRREPSWSAVQALAAALGVTCEAFTTPPAGQGAGEGEAAPKPRRGRPRKAAPEQGVDDPEDGGQSGQE